jgi:NTE family protein
MRIHLVASPLLATLGASSKLNAEWDFLSMLRDEGRRSAEAFLQANGQNIGKRSSIDLDVLLQQV